MMKRFYIEFKSWTHNVASVPLPCVLFEKTNDYRPLHDFSKVIAESTLKNVFLSFNEAVVKKFLDTHASVSILGAVVTAPDQDHAMSKLKETFKFVNIIGMMEVNESNIDRIDGIFGGAITNNTTKLT